MENNMQNTAKTSGSGPNGCTLGCLGFIVGIVFLFLSLWILGYVPYSEYGPIDPDGDYIIYDSGQQLPAGTWVMENPFYFVHKEATVKEMENWRQTKLVISDNGAFELIQPTALLAKVLLVSNFELINRESFDVSPLDYEFVREAMSSSITGQWLKQTDEKNQSHFSFQTDENNSPQRIQIAKVKEDSVKSGRLEEGMRLHWSLFSHGVYPKEGIVWKIIDP